MQTLVLQWSQRNLSFLGLQLDTNEMVLRLPADKLAHLMEMLSAWRGKKACRKRELLSLVGVLSHASKAVRPGRAFLRRLIDLLMVVKHLDHYVRLNGSAGSDIEWLFCFASTVLTRNQAPSFCWLGLATSMGGL